tara:strand:+ start:415 stop:597 length:183 start_codon:yes stop_codon:yes gene_type:complete
MKISLEEMSKAHLTQVQKTIVELQNQQKNIDQEILKLTDYLKSGLSTLEQLEDNEVVKEE